MTQSTNAMRTRRGMKHGNIRKILLGLFTVYLMKTQSYTRFDRGNKGIGAVCASCEVY